MTTANTMRRIGKNIKKELPAGFGFSLLVFPKSKTGMASSISTGTIEDMIISFRETADRLEKKEFIPSLEEN